MKTFYLIMIIFFQMVISSCANRPTDERVTDTQYINTIIAKNERKYNSKNYGTLFRSRSGKLYGMDSDSDIMLFSNGKVRMIEYGVGVNTYDGTYFINQNAEIEFMFPETTFPKVIIYLKNNDIYLTSVEKQGMVMGGRGGAAENSTMAPFWPFKLTVDDE